ncbi:MAG: glycosyltransferase [Mycobacterium sp.]
MADANESTERPPAPQASASPSLTPTLTVAHVIHSLGAGGAESVLVELARVAPSAGIRLIVVGLSEPGESEHVVQQLRDLDATVYEMRAGRYDASAAVGLVKLLRAEGVDIVHTHLKHADVVGGVAAKLARLPSVSTLHVIDIPTSRMHRLRVKFAVFARRHLSSTVIALSNAQRRWYRQYAAADAPIILLPNGIAAPQVNRDRAAIRAEMGVPEDSLLAVCVSLMRPEKGHADLLQAVSLLPAAVPLVVAMAGDGPLLESFQSTVASNPVLSERVRILGFRRDVDDLVAASDFVVHPSLDDALPTALISALAAGRPVVATDVGGIPDIVGPSCGLLVTAGQPAALCAGIADMVAMISTDPAALAATQQAERERYESLYSAEVWVRNLRKLYEQVIGARSGAGSQARRIALVEFLPSGGLYQFSLQMGEALARAGDQVELITGPSPELPSREPGCRVRSILPTWHPAAGGDVPDWWRRARRGVRAGQHTLAWLVLLAYLLRTRPDVVMWSAWRFPVDGWGVRAARKVLPHGVLALVAHEPRPLVEQPGQDGMYKTSGTLTRALGPAYSDLDVAYVLGESAKRLLTETWPVTAPVHIIPHGDEAIYAKDSLTSVETTGPEALLFGTITAYKGVDTIFEAWPLVLAHVPDAKLVIAGAPSSDLDKDWLRSEAERLDGVSLHTGYVPVPEVPEYFSRARCVVLPYKRGSQSGVVHLAQTLARPVVATTVGEIPTVVEDGVSGLLVAPCEPEALSRAMVRVLTDPELARKMGAAGAQGLAENASWDQVAERLREGLPDRR